MLAHQQNDASSYMSIASGRMPTISEERDDVSKQTSLTYLSCHSTQTNGQISQMNTTNGNSTRNGFDGSLVASLRQMSMRLRKDSKHVCFRSCWEVDMKMKFGRKHPRRICIDIMPPIEFDIHKYEEVRGNQLPLKLDDGRSIEIKIMKHEKHSSASCDDSLETDSLTTATITNAESTVNQGWKVKYRLDMEDFELTTSSGLECTFVIRNKVLRQERDIEFINEFERESFVDALSNLREAVRQKTNIGYNAFLKKINKKGDDPCNLLVEVVSASDLRIADVLGLSDPYVTVMMKDKVIHKTKVISKDLDPIWTVSNGSLFLITETVRDFYFAGSLNFTVSDFDKVGKDDTLGQVFVNQEHLYFLDGKREEFDLHMPRQNHKPQKGRIAIRTRVASEKDIGFSNRLNNSSKKRGIAKQTEIIAPPPAIRINRLMRKTRLDEITLETLRRVLPIPGPDHPEELEWMSTKTIEIECLKTSKTWIETGYGKKGKLYVEVIGCDNLPNLDSGGRNKTDAFVTLMYEDAIFSTDVVPDCLSPRFMPWTRRAFIFNVVDPTSQLFVSAHDEDSYPINFHDPIGRVAVNLSNFFPNTVHMLHYDLYKNSYSDKREKRGTVILRLLLEWNNPKERFLSIFDDLPKFHINVHEKKNFKIAKYTILGEKDYKKYSFEAIRHYLEELNESLINSILCVWLTLIDIAYWEDSHQFNIGIKTIKIPLNSLILFCSSVAAIENPNLIPGFTLLGIAWLFLALSKVQNSRPSPWARTHSYLDGFRMMRSGEFRPKKICPREDDDEDTAYLNAQIERRKEYRQKIEHFFDELSNYENEVNKIMKGSTDIADADDLTTKKTDPRFNFLPMKDFFYPYQIMFRSLCHFKRYIEYIITWKHYFVAFWITTICLVLGIIFLFIPWGYIIRWVLRLITWWKLGPWWKLLEILFPSSVHKSNIRKKDAEKKKKHKKKSAIANDLLMIRQQREDAFKLQSMKKLLFGQYTISLGHVKKLEKYFNNLPLPQSSATPLPKNSSMAFKIRNEKIIQKLGQRVDGIMIPENIDTIVDLTEQSTTLTQAVEMTEKAVDLVSHAVFGGVLAATDMAYDVVHGKEKGD